MLCKWLLLLPVATIGLMLGALLAYGISFVSLVFTPFDSLSFMEAIDFLESTDFNGIGYVSGIWFLFLSIWGSIMGAMTAVAVLFSTSKKAPTTVLALILGLLTIVSQTLTLLSEESHSEGFWIRFFLDTAFTSASIWFGWRNVNTDEDI